MLYGGKGVARSHVRCLRWLGGSSTGRASNLEIYSSQKPEYKRIEVNRKVKQYRKIGEGHYRYQPK